MSETLRILFCSDSHLGLDWTRRPRIERRRRWPEFVAAYERAIRSAIESRVDLIIHGGDMFYRSRISTELTMWGREPLQALSDQGIPFLWIPGNHERGQVPHPLLWEDDYIHIFHKAQTFNFRIRGMKVAVSGFPYNSNHLEQSFPDQIDQTGWKMQSADVRIMCMHQIVAGAKVGPINYTFRRGRDIIPGRLIPDQFAAVLSGHIHRHQILTRSLDGNPLAAPVIYPGSLERTAFAERNEAKGFLMLTFSPDDSGHGKLEDQLFIEQPTRPMIVHTLDPSTWRSPCRAREDLGTLLDSFDPEAIVQLRVPERHPDWTRDLLGLAKLRRLIPPTMNITVSWPRQG